jgi:hypothetical protein
MDSRTSSLEMLFNCFPQKQCPLHSQRILSVIPSVALFRFKFYVLRHDDSILPTTSIQVRSKDSQVKTQLVLQIFILFKVTTCFGLKKNTGVIFIYIIIICMSTNSNVFMFFYVYFRF